MEYLTKSQIVLLCLFVSFVSSMATGIVTVTLMQQAPEPVMQSITNVVEKTIEKITPTVVEKPGKTVVLKDEDLMVAAIDRNNKSVVSFRMGNDDGEVRIAGMGVIVSEDGLVVTDKANVGGGILLATVGGVKYALEVLPTSDAKSPLALGRLTPVTPTASTTPPVVFTPVKFSDGSSLKVGQTAIAIAGRDGKTVSTGLFSSVDSRTVKSEDGKKETTVLDGFTISQRLSASSSGAPVITLEGVVVGLLAVDDSVGAQSGIPALEAQKIIDAYRASLAPVSQKSR